MLLSGVQHAGLEIWEITTSGRPIGLYELARVVVVEHVARMVKSAIVSYIPLCVGEIFPLFIAQSSSITKFVKRLTK